MLVGLRCDRPRPFEHRPVDRMWRQVARELDVTAAKHEPAIADASGEWRHRVAAPVDRAPAFGQKDLPLVDAQRGHPAALPLIDDEPDIAGAHHDAIDGAALHHPATVIARSGRSRKGGR